jgi:hypothetical protein
MSWIAGPIAVHTDFTYVAALTFEPLADPLADVPEPP